MAGSIHVHGASGHSRKAVVASGRNMRSEPHVQSITCCTVCMCTLANTARPRLGEGTGCPRGRLSNPELGKVDADTRHLW